ncbi:MAG: winged helix-turn-helix domain-containing protein [Phenylobacterium sp.]
MARLIVRIELDSEARIGGDAIRLLELIEAKGSISAAGRAHGLTFRRAWGVLDELNRMFKTPVVAAQAGGAHGGGAWLTPFGQEIVRRYRAIETSVALAAEQQLDSLEAASKAAAPEAIGGARPLERRQNAN